MESALLGTGILAILIVNLLCFLSNTFAPECRDSFTAVKGGFFTPFIDFRCRKSVGSVYLTLLGVWGGATPPSPTLPPWTMRGLGWHGKHPDMTFHTIFKLPRLASLHVYCPAAPQMSHQFVLTLLINRFM